ncbi:UDP-N-acetylglucosamine [Emiliania huxleyi CCMP1516]|uniref:Uncharacterized protein n=2 Tax=Emiliania huxleyi TaxID=2903 RepID=A0A0D3KR40_EMIH1|nr:UDP-N-acetylglucosamine [Emiliania huxleyi CCMP1516]EOD38225.1 UDP-N-acetylglucosamine [Emiliania huxleyi CCMP1516]|eukprot:XP_005790654.1 UDP-N-acetylglucosamine [Emiliania huxleyi CCMP1516]
MAQASYAVSRKLRPEHALTWASSGNCAEERGEYEAAETHWKRSLQLARRHDGVYCNLGSMLRRLNRMRESRDAYAAALALNPRSVDAHIGMGKACAAPALKLSPEHVGANLAVAEGLHMWGEHGPCPELGGRSAIDFYRAVLQLAPDNTNAATHAAYDGAVPEGGPAPQAGTFGEADAPPGESVAALIAPLPPPGASEAEVAAAADAALSLWRRNGVVVFEKLLTPHATEALLSAVRAAEADDGATDCYHTTHGATDYTLVTRNAKRGTRSHKALPVSAAREALGEVAQRIGPFLSAALGGGGALALMESGFMVTRPGAEAQAFHRDVAPGVVSASSLAASLQVALVDTCAEQGVLEVSPGSHRFDPAAPETTSYAPPGLAYTIEPSDIARWSLHGTALLEQAQRC